MLSGNNSIIGQAGNAKTQAEIAEEKEMLEMATVHSIGKNKYGSLVESELQTQLNEYTNNRADIIDSNDELITVKFKDSNRYYEIAKDGSVEYIQITGGEKTLTVQCVNSRNTVIGEYSYTILRNKYSKTAPAIDGYVAVNEIIQGELTESITIQVMYYLVLQDDTTLNFTGLDASGKVTTNLSEIVTYMVGDGSNSAYNALKNKDYKDIISLLKIPDTYNNKPVTNIGNNAFQSSSIENVIIGKNTKNFGDSSLSSCKKLKTVTFKNSIINLGVNVFAYDSNFTEIKIESNEDDFTVEDNVLYTKDKKTLVLCAIGREGDFTIPDTVETIQAQAFRNSFLTNIIISDNVQKIENNAFCGATIESAVIGKSVNTIQNGAFTSCSKLKTVTFKNSIINLGINVFAYDSNFTEIKIESNEDNFTVEDNVLYTKDKKTLVLCAIGRKGDFTIPDTVETIQAQAFRNSFLTNIIISDNVQKIENTAFCGATIESAVIGKSVNTIQNGAFTSCNKLKTVTINSESIATQITSKTSANNLVNFAETIYIQDDITTIGSYITENYTKTTSDKEGYIKYVKN